jgi:topoisomerase-4 subunit A
LKIEKLDTNKVYSLVYYNGSTKSYYVKRFSFDVSDNTPISLISDGKGSYLVDISDDKHPRIMITFGGNYAQHDPETIDVEEFIGKKGLSAKGKMCSSHDLKKVEFIEPLHKPEDDIVPSDEPVPQNLAGDIEDSEEEPASDIKVETPQSDTENATNEVIDLDASDILSPNLELVNPEAEDDQPKKAPKSKKAPSKEKKSDEDGEEQNPLDIEPTLF